MWGLWYGKLARSSDARVVSDREAEPDVSTGSIPRAVFLQGCTESVGTARKKREAVSARTATFEPCLGTKSSRRVPQELGGRASAETSPRRPRVVTRTTGTFPFLTPTEGGGGQVMAMPHVDGLWRSWTIERGVRSPPSCSFSTIRASHVPRREAAQTPRAAARRW